MTGTGRMATPPLPPVHATTVAIDGHGVMLFGASGAGKSDLALRLVDRGACLVSDDYTVLRVEDDRLIATPPPAIAGRIEIRGLGIVAVDHRASAAIVLAIDLGEEVERMPEPRWRTIAGRRVRAMTIDPRPASAAIKVEWAVRMMVAEGEA